MKHHFLPEFYLKSWASGSESRLPYYAWVRDRIYQGYTSPGGTGYEENLNAVRNADKTLSHEVETKFFSPVDDRASVALRAILNDKPIDIRQRVHLTQFIMTMRFRDPLTIKAFVQNHRRQMTETTEEWEQYYRELNPDTNRSLSQELDDLGDHYYDRSAHGLLTGLSKGRMAEMMCSMLWRVYDTTRCKDTLMTCDNPVWVTDIRDPKAFFAFALSPTKILIGTHQPTDFSKKLPQVVRDYNRRIAYGAIKKVYARDVETWHMPFLEKHFPKEGFLPPIAAAMPDYKIDLPLSILNED